MLKIIFIFIFSMNIFTISVCSASDPTTLPLVRSYNLVWQGAFRVPWMRQGCDNWSVCVFGGSWGPIAYYAQGNSGNGSLFMQGAVQAQKTAEITIPNLSKSYTLTDLSTASMVRSAFYDITEGNLLNILANNERYNSGAVYFGGLHVYNNKLIGGVYEYYAGATQELSHFTSGLDISATGDFTGMWKVGDGGRTKGGHMCDIPEEWQNILGGKVLTGASSLTTISVSSAGPYIGAFDPDDLGVTIPAPFVNLLSYPYTHPLGPMEETNDLYMITDQITGVVFPEGTRSVLFFGTHGTGEFCYGEPTSAPELHLEPVPNEPGVAYCYDPAGGSKGGHAYPYKYQVWAYDANELLRVKNGEILAYNARPYEVWTFELPFMKPSASTNGVTYDSEHQLVYFAQRDGDGTDVPIIHGFKVDMSVGTSKLHVEAGGRPHTIGTGGATLKLQ